MPIAFNCQYCGQLLKVLESSAGKACLCPKCKTRVTAPLMELPEAQPLPPLSEYALSPKVQRPTHAQIEELSPVAPVSEPVKSKKPKARRLTQDERFLSESAPWYVRHLHWLLLLAMIPLFGSMFRKDDFDVIERMEHTIEQLSEEEREAFEDAQRPSFFGRNRNSDPFELLPQHKLVGAWLPRNTSAHWLLAAATTCFFLLFFYILTVRTTAKPWHLLLAALTTATIGIMLLISVQFISEISHYLSGIFAVVFFPFKVLGYAYHVALDSRSGFGKSLFGFTIGVGICEEWVKLLPVLYYLWNCKKLNWHAAFLWGLASGAGFGISEAVMYSSQMYNGFMPGDVYFVRFISCVALHGIWSGSVAIILYMMRSTLKDDDTRWWSKLGIVCLASAIPVILHGLYDTFLKMEMEFAALAVALFSFGFLAYLDYILHQPRMLSYLRGTGWAKV